VSEAAGAVAFFGVSSDAGPITQVTLHAQGNANDTGVDNVAFGTPAAAAVPEPGTLALAGLGGLGLAGYARRRKQAVA
jgi:hypothetical protein